jgi:hypothetical protein
MKELTPEQIQENWNKLVQLVEDTFEGERKENLLKMYEYFEDRMCVAPASGKPNYHNCHIGGYIEHVLHVVETAKKLMKVYQDIGAVIDFNEEELVFSALHHDLGKVGDLDHEYYLPQDDDWRRKKLNEWFTHNPELQYMSVTDRALWLLQHFDVKISELEYLAIKVSDGMYDDSNKQYLKTFKPENSFHSSLPYLIHWADHMATRAEYTEWKYEEEYENAGIRDRVQESVTTQVDREVKKVDADPEPTSSAKDLFNELFGE